MESQLLAANVHGGINTEAITIGLALSCSLGLHIVSPLRDEFYIFLVV